MNLKNRHLLTLLDFTPEEIDYLLNLAGKLKAEKKNGISHQVLKGKNIVLLFEKDSTRTRCAFEVAGYDLGMNVTYIGSSGSQMGKKESIKDTARVLGRMLMVLNIVVSNNKLWKNSQNTQVFLYGMD